MSEAVIALSLLDGRTATRVDDVLSLVAADASGQFGLLPGHAPLVTVLEAGLFRYRRLGAAGWTFGACAGGTLSCRRAGRGGTEVRIVSRRFLQSAQPEALQEQLARLLAEESALRLSTRESREQLDLALVRRMQELAEAAS
jgi:F-type H+-transporting ATPase subunit epsilon